MRQETIIWISLHEFYFVRYLHYELGSDCLKAAFVDSWEVILLTVLAGKGLHPDVKEEKIGVQGSYLQGFQANDAVGEEQITSFHLFLLIKSAF